MVMWLALITFNVYLVGHPTNSNKLNGHDTESSSMWLPCFLLPIFSRSFSTDIMCLNGGRSSRNNERMQGLEGRETKNGEDEWLRTTYHFGKLSECSIRKNKNYGFITTRINFMNHWIFWLFLLLFNFLLTTWLYI